jgi:hypothetical protein
VNVARVITPRRVFGSVTEFAAHLECSRRALYLGHLIWRRGAWRLRPLDEATYARWHRTVWRRAQQQKVTL